MQQLPFYIDLVTQRVVYPNDLLVGVRGITLTKGETYHCPITFVSGNATGVPLNVSGFTLNVAQVDSRNTPLLSVNGLVSGSANFTAASPLLDYAIGQNDYLDVVTDISFSGNGTLYNLADLNTRISNSYSTTPATEYYPLHANPSGYLTGVDLTPYATTAALTATGTGLQSQITALQGASGNYLTNSRLDTDGNLAANSDTKLATQKAVKTYVDNHSASLPQALGTNDSPEFNSLNVDSIFGDGWSIFDGGAFSFAGGLIAGNDEGKLNMLSIQGNGFQFYEGGGGYQDNGAITTDGSGNITAAAFDALDYRLNGTEVIDNGRNGHFAELDAESVHVGGVMTSSGLNNIGAFLSDFEAIFSDGAGNFTVLGNTTVTNLFISSGLYNINSDGEIMMRSYSNEQGEVINSSGRAFLYSVSINNGSYGIDENGSIRANGFQASGVIEMDFGSIYTDGNGALSVNYIRNRDGGFQLDTSGLALNGNYIIHGDGSFSMNSINCDGGNVQTDGSGFLTVYGLTVNSSAHFNNVAFFNNIVTSGMNSVSLHVDGSDGVVVQDGYMFFPSKSAPAFSSAIRGAIYYNTGSHKLMVAGATAWEEITSVM